MGGRNELREEVRRRGPARGRLGLLLAIGVATAGGASEAPPPARPAPPAAAPAADPVAAASLFAMPQIAQETRAALGDIPEGDLAGAAAALDALVARHPEVGAVYANRAGLAMLQGDRETALTLLEEAAAHGYADFPRLAADPVFAGLEGEPRLAALVAAAPAVVPAPVRDAVALVAAGNTAWNPETERLEPRFAFPPEPAARVLPSGKGPAAQNILAELWKRGRAAGNHGDLYDNRDRGHSRIDPAAHPQLAFVAYSEAARAADLDYGLNQSLTFDHPTFGNSSTAITDGALWRSLPRYAMTQPDGTGPLRLWQNAAANQLYVYPAHHDYEPKNGDLFPANTPYLLVSRGSSGSDKPFLEALALTYAAFRPDTKARLVAGDLLVPTVQMVFRRSLQDVTSREDYLSGKAHPAAFEGYRINPARMVSLAQSIKPGDIPPRVRIRVTAEELGTEGVDFFGAGLSEQLFDTPSAIARVWRSSRYRRTMQVSAAETEDPNGRKLAFEWRLLQGDPERVKIEPAADGRSARITLDWQEPFRISDDNPLVERAGRHRGLRGQRGARQRAGDPLLVLPARGGAALRAGAGRGDAHRRDRLRRPPGRLRRPDAAAAGRLARQLPLRRGRDARGLDPDPPRPAARSAGRLRCRGRAHPRPRHRRYPGQRRGRRLPARPPARRRARDRGGLGPALSRSRRPYPATRAQFVWPLSIRFPYAFQPGQILANTSGIARFHNSCPDVPRAERPGPQGRGVRAARARAKARKAASGRFSAGRPLPRQSRSHSASSQ